jgi:hypothetical protein
MIIMQKAEPDKLIESIYKNIEIDDAKQPHRGYIGASSIGDECELKLWMQYKKPELKKQKPATTIMAANDGHRSEDLVASLIRQSPYNIELTTHDSNGKQLGFSDLEGNYKGHWDGLILGIPQAPKTTHVWEHKAKNQKYYDALTKLKEKVPEKSVLEEWDYNYYCQGVTYMHYSGTTRHYTTVALAGTRGLQSIRTNENPKLAIHLRDKAQRIINYISPPVGISTNPSFYKCKLCDFYNTCPSLNKNITL